MRRTIRSHGSQEGAYLHGYYGDYCYLPLYCFCLKSSTKNRGWVTSKGDTEGGTGADHGSTKH
jgi:hypothetical protein